MNKRKKVNLSSIFMLAMLMACLVLFMVISLRKNQDITFKGGISYQIDNIDAKVTGSVSGSSKKVNLANLNFDSNTNIEKEGSKWENKSLYFNKKNNEASIIFTVTNNSSTDDLYFVIKDNNSNIENVSTNILKFSSTEATKEYNYTDDFITIPVDDNLTEEKENVVSFKLDFKVEDLKAGIKKDSKWNYEITLTSESPIKTVEYYKTLEYGALDFKLNSYDNTAEVRSYVVDKVSLTKGDIQIPSYVKADSGEVFRVATIPSLAFYADENASLAPSLEMTSITLPSTIERIGSSAFYSCSNLKEVRLNEGLKSIDQMAFAETLIEEVFIPSTVNSINYAFTEGWNILGTGVKPKNLKRINIHEDNTVYDSRNDCNAIIETSTNTLITGTNISTVPEGVENIGKAAFQYCKELKDLKLPSTLKIIESAAFQYCESLCGELFIPEGVQLIDVYAFGGTNYTKLSLPGSLETLYSSSFKDLMLDKPFDYIKISDANRMYDSRYNCNAIIESATNTLIMGSNNTVIPHDVVSISSDALNNCNKLKEVIIPEGVTSVGTNAFLGCNGLTSLHIPSTLQTIGENAFDFCGFDYISVAEGNTVYDSRNNCNALIETETNKLLFGSSNTILPEDISSLKDNAFKNCKKLTAITIPEKITEIPESCFRDCESLASVNFPSGLTKIGDNAFYNNISLTNVTIPDSVTSISTNSFTNSGLKTIIVEEGNMVYDSRDNCNAIIETSTNTLIKASSSTIIPNTVVSINGSAFNGCRELKSITIPSSVTEIGFGLGAFNTNLFAGCDNLTSIKVAAASSVFDSRDNCNAIIHSETNTLVSACQKTIIPSTVTTIGAGAFKGIKGIRSVVVPKNVTSISSGAFSGCENLQTIKICATVPPTIEVEGFLSFNSFDDTVRIIRVPKASLEVYKTADAWNLYADKIVGF